MELPILYYTPNNWLLINWGLARTSESHPHSPSPRCQCYMTQTWICHLALYAPWMACLPWPWASPRPVSPLQPPAQFPQSLWSLWTTPALQDMKIYRPQWNISLITSWCTESTSIWDGHQSGLLQLQGKPPHCWVSATTNYCYRNLYTADWIAKYITRTTGEFSHYWDTLDSDSETVSLIQPPCEWKVMLVHSIYSLRCTEKEQRKNVQPGSSSNLKDFGPVLSTVIW